MTMEAATLTAAIAVMREFKKQKGAPAGDFLHDLETDTVYVNGEIVDGEARAVATQCVYGEPL